MNNCFSVIRGVPIKDGIVISGPDERERFYVGLRDDSQTYRFPFSRHAPPDLDRDLSGNLILRSASVVMITGGKSPFWVLARMNAHERGALVFVDLLGDANISRSAADQVWGIGGEVKGKQGRQVLLALQEGESFTMNFLRTRTHYRYIGGELVESMEEQGGMLDSRPTVTRSSSPRVRNIYRRRQ